MHNLNINISPKQNTWNQAKFIHMFNIGLTKDKTKDSLNSLPMSSKRSLHKLSNTVHTIGDFWTCNGDIFEGTNSTSIELGVAEGNTSRGR